VDIDTGKATKKTSGGEAMGKRGEEIPVMGRIVALADVYDALSSNRVYKSAWTEEDTLREIRSLGGSQFDPDIVDVFFEVLPSIKTISAKFGEASGTVNEQAAEGNG
jgi:HD-GYP domain-containing protein (c-di-GMP phosphodiesterase class II)